MLTCNITYLWYSSSVGSGICYSRRSKDAGPEIVKRSLRVQNRKFIGAYQSVMQESMAHSIIPAPPWVLRTRPSSGFLYLPSVP